LSGRCFSTICARNFDARKTDRSTGRAKRLEDFHDKICTLRFLDPACGCGNFLVITYRELRQLELETLQELLGAQKEFSLDEVNRLRSWTWTSFTE